MPLAITLSNWYIILFSAHVHIFSFFPQVILKFEFMVLFLLLQQKLGMIATTQFLIGVMGFQ